MSKKRQFSTQAVKNFLSTTGFPFEWKMERTLAEKKWEVWDASFLDLEEGEKREIDIVAGKTINCIDVFLIIECKYSKKDSWIFFSPNEKISRYYGYFVCSPRPERDSLKTITSHLRIFNSAEPTAFNYKSYDNFNNRQSDDSKITDALYKVVKALIYCQSQYKSRTKRQIYFPVILFSGPIFSASYSQRMRVKKVNYLQFPFEFESEAYGFEEGESDKSWPEDFGLDLDYDKGERNRDIQLIKKTYKESLKNHLIEFMSGGRFRAYLDQLESEIGKIDINLWPVESKKE